MCKKFWRTKKAKNWRYRKRVWLKEESYHGLENLEGN